MRLLLVADTYPPSAISGALQMRDLAEALVALGHRPLVLVPDPTLKSGAALEELGGVEIYRVRAPKTKDVSYPRRLAAEFLLPWVLRRAFRSSPFAKERWDGIAWYSPTIFLGPMVSWFKRLQDCRSYLILRDLFPDWAVDAGVLRRDGLAHKLLKSVERYQYRQADVIGVQTPANLPIVARDAPVGACLEVLHNWLAPLPPIKGAYSHPALVAFQGRKIFIYTGNMGVAQDLDAFVDLASRLRSRTDIGFLMIGRGSERGRLRDKVAELGLDNFRVEDQVSPTELSPLLSNCHAGIIALHPAHGTHNIPGKLLTYLHAGLPVLARINPGNDLQALVVDEGIGRAVVGDGLEPLVEAAIDLADDPSAGAEMARRGRLLAARLFTPEAAAAQLVRGLAGT